MAFIRVSAPLSREIRRALPSRPFNVEQRGIEAGVQYQRSAYSSFGLALRHVDGDYPKRVATPGDGREKTYQQQSLIARVGYTPSGLSDLQGQLGYTQRLHDDPSVADFRGLTGRLGYTRTLSGRTRLRVEVYRDLFYVEEVGTNYAENLGEVLTADYRYSAKLAFAAAVEHFTSDYRSSPGFSVAGAARSDEVLSLSLGADYRPFYRFSILPEYRYENRSSNVLSSSYSYSTIGVDLAYRYGSASRQ